MEFTNQLTSFMSIPLVLSSNIKSFRILKLSKLTFLIFAGLFQIRRLILGKFFEKDDTFGLFGKGSEAMFWIDFVLRRRFILRSSPLS